ncbi:MAG: type II secretion system protein [Candidatus Eisenbacteria bacterium]|nr:type II secretion system protein [Candidatus Eisenbacteria bacterium]
MRIQREAGMSLIEVMVAVIVFSIAIVFVYQMFWSGGSRVYQEGERRVALKMAERKIEELKYAGYASTGSDADWTSVHMGVGSHPTNPAVVLDDMGTVTTVDDLTGSMQWAVRETTWASMGVTVRAKIVNLRLAWPQGAPRDRVRLVTLVGE